MTETDPELRARAVALDEALPKATGADAAAMDRFRSRVNTARTSGALAPAGGANAGRGGAAQAPSAPGVDLTKIAVPVIAINGSFDNPYSKTMRLWREVKVFHNVILPEKTHLTAISSGAAMPKQYIEEIARFIDAYDVQPR